MNVEPERGVTWEDRRSTSERRARKRIDPWHHLAGFYLLRHGECDWNRRSLCVGQADRPLSETGRRQAERAREAVRKVEPARIVYSTLVRATETARLIAEGLQCDLVPEEDLREACLGVREGTPEGDPEDDFISAWLAGAQIQGAEPFDLFRARIVGAIAGNVADAGSSLLVAHWGVFAAVSRTIGAPVFDPEHCVLYRVGRNRSEWFIERA